VGKLSDNIGARRAERDERHHRVQQSDYPASCSSARLPPRDPKRPPRGHSAAPGPALLVEAPSTAPATSSNRRQQSGLRAQTYASVLWSTSRPGQLWQPGPRTVLRRRVRYSTWMFPPDSASVNRSTQSMTGQNGGTLVQNAHSSACPPSPSSQPPGEVLSQASPCPAIAVLPMLFAADHPPIALRSSPCHQCAKLPPDAHRVRGKSRNPEKGATYLQPERAVLVQCVSRWTDSRRTRNCPLASDQLGLACSTANREIVMARAGGLGARAR
jgi:hypothetical protein